MSDIYVDADGCPVIEETLQAGEDFGFPVTLVCDTSHTFHYENVVVLMADQGRDSTDFLLLSRVKKGDIVVTQDYGLAALVLSKEGYPISCSGIPYTTENINRLLTMRHVGSIERKHGNYGRHAKKRTQQDDDAFLDGLYALCERAQSR
jgi:uncharacterized protein